jgi:hypothetical protein
MDPYSPEHMVVTSVKLTHLELQTNP